MNKLGHILFATFIFTVIYVIITNFMVLDTSQILFSFGIFLIYSLLPDIDKNNSWIRKQLNQIIILLLLFFTIVSIVNKDRIALVIAAILIISQIVLTLIKHRGPIHSIIFGVIASAPLLFLNPIFFFAGLIGVMTHLLADKI